ncbi:hypothetical protein T11_5620 [Trichinella zimbabwensis]|uniref:Uncharacterized protein n=1 Tax=Trichinella zimbabwensis TaxID=268475 RepID=A0A0V1HXA6_9BILA|nr:hypothetical protein T11_5620 [Trichinella zimbabwensis]
MARMKRKEYCCCETVALAIQYSIQQWIHRFVMMQILKRYTKQANKKFEFKKIFSTKPQGRENNTINR